MSEIVVKSAGDLLNVDILTPVRRLPVSPATELLKFRQEAVRRLRKVDHAAIEQLVSDWMRNVVSALEQYPALATVYRYELFFYLIPWLNFDVSIGETYEGKTISNSLFGLSLIKGEAFWYVTQSPFSEGVRIMKFLQKVYRREGRL